MEHIDHDYLSTQVMQIPCKSKTNAKRGAKQIPSFPFVRNPRHSSHRFRLITEFCETSLCNKTARETSFSSSFILEKSPKLSIPDAVFTKQNVLPRSGAQAHTVSDDASADQRYNCNLHVTHAHVYKCAAMLAFPCFAIPPTLYLDYIFLAVFCLVVINGVLLHLAIAVSNDWYGFLYV